MTIGEARPAALASSLLNGYHPLAAASASSYMAQETLIQVHLHPLSRQPGITGWKDGVLEVHVSAPPARGEANRELVALLAETLRVPRSAVRLVSGARSRRKLVGVAASTSEDIRQALGQPAPGGKR